MRNQVLELLNDGKFTSFHAVIAMISIKRGINVKIVLQGNEAHENANFLQNAVNMLFTELQLVTIFNKNGTIVKYL